MNSGTSNFLNASRWVAAFLVVVGHVCAISVNYYAVAHPSLPLRAIHFLSGFGHISVIVFFVISGFLVGGRAILGMESKGFDIIAYLISRFSRIYTVLVPALIVGFILDRVGIDFFNASGIYTHPAPQFYTNTFGNNITRHLGFDTFLGNLMQLQTIVVSSLGSNGPLWSLANEWWYYVLFGLFMVAYGPGPVLVRFAMVGAIVAMVIVLPLKISLWFVIWGVGVGAAVLDRYWSGWRFDIGAGVAIVCFLAVRWTKARLIPPDPTSLAMEFAPDLVTALGYSIVLVCAKNLKKPRMSGAHHALASFSYTVYLVHFPAIVFAAAFMKDVLDIGFERQPTAATIIYALALLVILYGYAWLFAALTEVHTDAVRSRLSLAISNLPYRVHLEFLLSDRSFQRRRN